MRILEMWRLSGKPARPPDPTVDHRMVDTHRDRILAATSPFAFVALIAGWGYFVGWWGR